MVEGELWGTITVASLRSALPADTERRLAGFTELVATAIANTESRARVDRLTEEQAALRRVATLVANEASLPEVFARVAEEASRALGHVDCGRWRDEGDRSATLVAVAGNGPGSRIDAGMRQLMDGDSSIGFALRDGRPSRVGDYSAAGGGVAAQARSLGSARRSPVRCSSGSARGARCRS
jgi:GAF domain-containing protein